MAETINGENADLFVKSIHRHSVETDSEIIAKAIKVERGLRICDVGCGPGILASKLSQKGAEVVGVDGSQRMLELLRQRHSAKIEAIRADARQMPFACQRFDRAILSFVLHHLADRKECLAECERILSEDGKLVIADRIPINLFALFLFPLYWILVYKWQHEWNEAMPKVYTVKQITRDLKIAGLIPEAATRIDDPIWPRSSIKIKELLYPKMIIICGKIRAADLG